MLKPILGEKAAKSLTAEERGKMKHVYHKLKFLWEQVAEMVRGGMTAQQVACDKIYEVYGNSLSVAKIFE